MKMSNKRNTNVSYYSESSSDNDDGEDSIRDYDLFSLKANSSNGSSNCNENEQPKRRLGRGPSKRPCLNRNALMARQNRQKKKEYVTSIENKLTYYKNENIKLVNILKQQTIDLKRLNAEVSYLKNVLKNNSSITALLNSMNSAINKNGNNRKVNDHNQLNYINQNKLTNRPENNTMVKEWMNHGAISMNDDNKGRNLHVCKYSLDSFTESDHIYASSEHEHDELFDFEGVDCDLHLGGITPLDNRIIPSNINSNDIPTNTSSSSSSSPSSFVLPNKNNISEYNTDINEELMLFNNEDNVFSNTSNDCSVNNSRNLLESENFFENLDASGICLHVNAGKISLEFCSICHLNSINSEDPQIE